MKIVQLRKTAYGFFVKYIIQTEFSEASLKQNVVFTKKRNYYFTLHEIFPKKKEENCEKKIIKKNVVKGTYIYIIYRHLSYF